MRRIVFFSLVLFSNLSTAFAEPDPPHEDRLREGYALIIGQSKYEDALWPSLDVISPQIKSLAKEFRYHFKEVKVLENVKGADLNKEISDFLEKNGEHKDARLLIYYAGHGYTEVRQDTDDLVGYITGSDAPLVDNSQSSYDNARTRSMSMDKISQELRETRAKSVLMIFDSCFSGSFFLARSPENPPFLLKEDQVNRLLEKPARRIITAGRKDQKIPAKSPIPDLIIRALHGDADKYNLGIISSSDLGRFIQIDLLKRGDLDMSPQMGSLQTGGYSAGEFLFEINKTKISQTDALIQNYTDASDKGDVSAKINLGDILANKNSDQNDVRKAASLYKEASDQNSSTGQYMLGVYYRDGVYYNKDYYQAAKYFKLAADQNLAPAQSALGWLYELGQGGLPRDTKKAAELYRLSAAQGDVDGAYFLGQFYYNGRGYLQKDYSKATELFKFAAEKGSVAAQSMLGYAFLNGRGVDKNPATAVKYFQFAARQGDDVAQTNLGASYECGWGGLQQDWAAAAHWYGLAAKKGNALANQRLTRVSYGVRDQKFCD